MEVHPEIYKIQNVYLNEESCTNQASSLKLFWPLKNLKIQIRTENNLKKDKNLLPKGAVDV